MSTHAKRGSRLLTNAGRCWGIHSGCQPMNEAIHHNVARTMASSSKTLGLLWPQHLHLHWTMGLRVMEGQWQLLHQCHQGLIDVEAPGISTVADATRSLRPHENQSAHFQGWRQEECCHLPKLALGYNGVSSSRVLRLHPPLLHHLLPTGLPGGVGEVLRHQHHFGWHDWCDGWDLQQCQGPRCLEPGAFPTTNGQQRNSVRLGDAPHEAPPNPCSFIPERFPPDHIAELKWDHLCFGLSK